MTSGLKRYEFSERLAEILGGSRRDYRFRVTLLVSEGLIEPGPRGRGSPPATPEYAAHMLIGAMAAPQQAHTVDAIRCYRELQPTIIAGDNSVPRVVFGPESRMEPTEPGALQLLPEQLAFGQVLTRLFELASAIETRNTLAGELFGIWISRGFPVAAVQLSKWSAGRRSVITQRYELANESRPPIWLDPERGGVADPGLHHTIFLPVSKFIEIGKLTTLADNRSSIMLNLSPKLAAIAKLAKLARNSRHRRAWEHFLAGLSKAQTWADKVDPGESRHVEVTGFGTNPGNLRMLTYVPNDLPPGAPLVVLLHGCTQNAAAIDKGTGWSTLAERSGFALLLPQQQWNNNPLRCFNWFRPEDTERDGGEPLSIKQMIERMIIEHDIDPSRVYITGLSSGGAMTSVMLATYPELFAGGAVISGVPYRSANGLQEAFETIFKGRSRSAQEWGELVRSATSHQGPWPKVSVWHGDADSSVKPINADETVKQWTNVHGLSSTPTIEKTVNGFPHQVWQDTNGDDLVELFTITGMTHGAPLDAGDQHHQCGTAAPYFHDVGISSAHHIARFWGLPEARPEATAHQIWEATPSPDSTKSFADMSSDNVRTIWVHSDGNTQTEDEPSSETPKADAGSRGSRGSLDVGDIISKSLEAASLLKDSKGRSEQSENKGAKTPLGLDIEGIVGMSLEAAGLLKNSPDTESGPKAPLGLNVQGIIAKSLEAAGVLKESIETSSSSEAGNDGLAGSDWIGEGWELLTNDSSAIQDSPMLYGEASSGGENGIGKRVRSVSRQVVLGHRPELSYLRRLNLSASVNDFTTARFTVLVDDVPVDEVRAVGMSHTEAEWLQRSNIDLADFAGRTVTLTFEVAANSNVHSEVSAKAWVDRITVKNLVEVAAL